MPPLRVRSSLFQREFGRFAAIARREPVMITNHGRDELVMLSADDYARLLKSERGVRSGKSEKLSVFASESKGSGSRESLQSSARILRRSANT
jgi:prevent-host-death family protein